MDGGIAGSLNSRGCVQECCPLPAATEGGLIRAAQLPGRASSSESELTSWWVYWWISFSLRIIWRFGKGRTPNLRGEGGDKLLRTLHPDGAGLKTRANRPVEFVLELRRVHVRVVGHGCDGHQGAPPLLAGNYRETQPRHVLYCLGFTLETWIYAVLVIVLP